MYGVNRVTGNSGMYLTGNRPSLSVVLCVNRTNPYLAQAVGSVLAQEDGDFEFLIAANACSDDLVGELNGLVGGDSRAKIFRTAIGQLSFNLNYLADQANGDYLVRMDSDDVCEPNRLAVLRQSLAERPVDVLGSWAYLIDDESRLIGEFQLPVEHMEIVRKLPYGTVLCHPTVAIRREFLLSLRGYLGGFVSEDTDLWLRGVRLGASFRNIPAYLLRYRVHAAQSSGSRRGYAEVAGHWLRELLSEPSWYIAKGFFVAVIKCLSAPLLALVRSSRLGIEGMHATSVKGSEKR